MNRRGKLLLILDGFDEMARQVDYQTVVDNFWELAKLVEDGSKVILTSRTEGAQLASLAPPVHVALYRESQVLASLDDVLERLKEAGGPLSPDPGRSVVFVTGPSRTADIEQVLIRGVHGPREVHAILIGEPCLT